MMKIYILILTVLFSAWLSPTAFGQKAQKQKPQKKTIICSDCFSPNAKPIYLPKPEYPKAALAVNASGTVEVMVVIDKKGNIIKADAISGHPLLHAAAIKAALQAKFKPITLFGKAIQVSGVINYVFAPKDSVKVQIN